MLLYGYVTDYEYFNEWHSANTSKKIRAVVETNVKSCKYLCMLRMFELRASGMSPNKIAHLYSKESILTPSDYKEQKFWVPNTRQFHHLWFCGTVKQVLQNSTYLGHLVQMRTTMLSYKNKKTIKRDHEDMVWVYNTHEAIVSQELWDKCREMEGIGKSRQKDQDGAGNAPIEDMLLRWLQSEDAHWLGQLTPQAYRPEISFL